MTILSIVCGRCNKYSKLENNIHECPYCKVKSENNVRVSNVIHEYYDIGLGQVVKGRTHRKEIMKEKGLEELGNERKFVEREEVDKKIEQRLDKEYKSLNNEAMRYLHNA